MEQTEVAEKPVAVPRDISTNLEMDTIIRILVWFQILSLFLFRGLSLTELSKVRMLSNYIEQMLMLMVITLSICMNSVLVWLIMQTQISFTTL
ncbi:MAG: hypothetical protein EBR82_19715 [Caulobacteraceae bacterium]|nr:hypothetical protein [Caulobacteraceae bacterium]